jgi:hypothetical protein
MRIIKFHIITLLLGILYACGEPRDVTANDSLPPIYPDYTQITIPCNIAPLNFMVLHNPQQVLAVLTGEGKTVRIRGGQNIRFSGKKWDQLVNSCIGNEHISVQLYVKKDGVWTSYKPFLWTVTEDRIDPYLSYRLIEPGYEVWNKLLLCERHLESFKVRILADNALTENSCMNCHTYGNQDPGTSFFHLRGPGGGTILNRNGKLRKIDTKTEGSISAGVYGNFHPSGRYGVFSTNIIIPEFHAFRGERLEVYDTESDLIVVDFDHNTSIPFPPTEKKELRTFPVFSADGNTVYYCRAPYMSALPDSVRYLRYDLMSISFNPHTGMWGDTATIDTVFSASRHKLSVCHPKTSPDGRYLLFTVAEYGTFPIWHRETDLYLLNLETGSVDALNNVNSALSDTYHSWSSDSRWFVFASKRDDGMYGKPYFCHIDKDGLTSKPFVLPQKDPSTYFTTFKSFNIPELSKGEVPFNALDIEKIYRNMDKETLDPVK